MDRSSPRRSDRLAQNVARVRDRIRSAATGVGRDPDSVRLVAVTKSVPVEVVNRLPPLGLVEVGENRIAVAEEKIPRGAPGLRWHLVGHLQRNKARRAVRLFSLIHSVDSERLIEALARLADEEGVRVRGLLQVNVSGERQKHGVEPDGARHLLEVAGKLQGLDLMGLMGMGPLSADPEESRPAFRRLASLAAEATAENWYRQPLRELSMGMTDDFGVAVEEGATMVRVGTALFRDVDSDEPAPECPLEDRIAPSPAPASPPVLYHEEE